MKQIPPTRPQTAESMKEMRKERRRNEGEKIKQREI
jgi:hypothetical protein